MPQTETEKNSKTLRKYRRSIAAAIEFIRSREKAESYTSISLEELIDQQIEVLEGRSGTEKPSYTQRLDSLHGEVIGAIQGLKQVPPEAFRVPDPNDDVNTRR